MRYPVITLCGSTKFKEEFQQANSQLSLAGNVVLSVCQFSHADGLNITDEQSILFDSLHRQKIDMSDEIYVINPGGYIGESTRNEIAYAKLTGKKISYMFYQEQNFAD